MATMQPSLFGSQMSPEDMQQQLIDQRAAQFAAQSQAQQLGSMGYKAGANLGGGLAKAFGVDTTDPMIKQATQMRQLASQFDTTTPEGMAQFSQALRSINPQAAQQAAEKAQAMRMEQAKFTTEQATAASKLAEKITPEQKNAAAQADAEGLQRGTPEWQKAYKESLGTLLAKPEKTMAYGSEAERLAKALFNKPFTQLDQAQASAVDKELERRGLTKAKASASIFSPEIKMTDKELDWRKQYLGENKDVINQAANVRQSLNLLDSGTPFAQAAFNNTVVSAFGGDKQKSNAEIKRLANTGALDTRIANTITNFFEGKTTATTINDQKAVLDAVDKALEARYNSSAKDWTNRLTKAKVDPALVIPSYSGLVGTKGSSGQTVNYQGSPATVVSSNPDGTIVIEQNGVRKTLAPKKQ